MPDARFGNFTVTSLDFERRAMRRATYDVRTTVLGRARLERGGRAVPQLSTSDSGRAMSAVYQPTADIADAVVGAHSA